MRFIIASVGRSGSTLIGDLISQATSLPVEFTSNLKNVQDGVIKTHVHFAQEPDYQYRAIFIYSRDITDVISSMYSGRVDMKKHLRHLEVSLPHRIIFRVAMKLAKKLRHWNISTSIKKWVFRYMIQGDKFRFKENTRSWRDSKHTLFVVYEDLCDSKDSELRRMSDFLGIQLPDFQVRPRQAKEDNTPIELLELARLEYKNFFNELT